MSCRGHQFVRQFPKHALVLLFLLWTGLISLDSAQGDSGICFFGDGAGGFSLDEYKEFLSHAEENVERRKIELLRQSLMDHGSLDEAIDVERLYNQSIVEYTEAYIVHEAGLSAEIPLREALERRQRSQLAFLSRDLRGPNFKAPLRDLSPNYRNLLRAHLVEFKYNKLQDHLAGPTVSGSILGRSTVYTIEDFLPKGSQLRSQFSTRRRIPLADAVNLVKRNPRRWRDIFGDGLGPGEGALLLFMAASASTADATDDQVVDIVSGCTDLRTPISSGLSEMVSGMNEFESGSGIGYNRYRSERNLKYRYEYETIQRDRAVWEGVSRGEIQNPATLDALDRMRKREIRQHRAFYE